MERTSVLVGKKVIACLRPAECCEFCAHCLEEHYIDDPFGYYCNKDKDRPQFVERKTFKERMSEGAIRDEETLYAWQVAHTVCAGTVCDDFKAADIKLKVIPDVSGRTDS